MEQANSVEMAEIECKDPFSYTKLNEFTSEIFKIEIGGLPRKVGYGQLKKLLNQKLNLKCCKIKVPGPQATWGFITFRCEEDRTAALTTLNGFKWRGRELTAKKANPAADPLIKKRKTEEEALGPNKKEKIEDESVEKIQENLTEQMLKAVMPLGAMKYEDQLAQKSLEMRKQLVGIGRSLWKCGARGGPKWLLSNQTSFDQQCCEFQGLTPSPVVDEYRNKCEFTVGVQPNGNGKPVVGFRLAKYSQGSLWVAQPTPCTIVPQPVIKIAQVNYIKPIEQPRFNV
ncbi:tRNA methyltransferase 2 [Chamberlinius hualienensis]